MAQFPRGSLSILDDEQRVTVRCHCKYCLCFRHGCKTRKEKECVLLGSVVVFVFDGLRGRARPQLPVKFSAACQHIYAFGALASGVGLWPCWRVFRAQPRSASIRVAICRNKGLVDVSPTIISGWHVQVDALVLFGNGFQSCILMPC